MARRPRLWPILLALPCCALGGCGSETSGGGGGGGADAPPCAERSPSAATDEASGRIGVCFDNARGEGVLGTAFFPAGSSLARPAVVVLHGSGGLYDEPLDPAEPPTDPGTAELERQFEEWSGLLTGAGYVVLMPGSFFSRGFFDWNRDPHPDLDVEDRLVFRTLDALAAVSYLCRRTDVRCDDVGVLGFSNGGSTVLLAMHEAVAEVEGLEVVAPLDPEEDYAVGVAFYPGCGLQALIGLDPSDFYRPRAFTQILHAEQDPLLEHCPTRMSQAAASADGGESRLDLFVYEGEVGHGFDSTPEGGQEETARLDGRARTLSLFETHLGP